MRAIYHKIIHNPLKKERSYQVLPGNITGSISRFSHKSIFPYKLFAYPLREKKKSATKRPSKILSQKHLFEQMGFGKVDESHVISAPSVLSVLQ